MSDQLMTSHYQHSQQGAKRGVSCAVSKYLQLADDPKQKIKIFNPLKPLPIHPV
jgi:hypothetical protein